MTDEIILYTTHCPKCIVLEEKLNEKGIKFTTITDKKIMRLKGFMSAPMLETNGKIMTFAEANSYINTL